MSCGVCQNMKSRDAIFGWLSRREFLKIFGQCSAGTMALGLSAKPAWSRSGQSIPTPSEPLRANLSVDVGAVKNHIDPHIYGTLIEHIGRVVYGGVYEEGSTLSDERGIRKDVLTATRDLGVTNLRWPGGDFASQ